ncbi:MAG: DinB family protein, partial [Cyclobacteriaceae bacterium]|nr:DinB family protein [Cyclobacteriaceae bacterium]
RSVKPLREALMLPKFKLKLVFGKANRPSKTYGGLVKKYPDKLGGGGKASAKYYPKSINVSQKEALSIALIKNVKKLSDKINNFSEQELDFFILPHPLLGKVTLREMMYFTIYHVEHHIELTKRNLKNIQN